jgi:hypothetical protein
VTPTYLQVVTYRVAQQYGVAANPDAAGNVAEDGVVHDVVTRKVLQGKVFLWLLEIG